MTQVTLRVHEDGADDERVEQLTSFLRTELSELLPVSAAPGSAPDGAKAVDVADLGTLLATVAQSTVLAALINAVSSWLGQRRERSVTIEADGEPLELTGAPTPEELEQRSAWLGRRLHRHALIIASHVFADPGLSSLRAPAHDAARLSEVLADPRIGGLHVRTLINSSAAEINEAVEDFFADRAPDDLLVLHFSGHGVKDEAGELHFATSSTKLSRLAGTAVSADFVARRMNRSRSRRVVLLLDCCYSGAFGRGMVARAGGSVGLEEQFGGSGRAVITASSAMEYAFEGASVADASEGEPSVFTSALVEGLESGDADRDQDGHVGLDELYEYVYDRVRRVTPHQTPGKWMLDVRGDLRIARRARPVSVPSALPSELQEAIDHSLPGVRAGAIPELLRMLTVAHEGRALAARLALRRLGEDDSRMVASAAREALGEPAADTVAPPTPAASPTTSKRSATPPSSARPASSPTSKPAAPASTSKPAADRTPRKLSVPPATMGVGASDSPEGVEAGSIPKAPRLQLPAALPRLVAGLALTLLVIGMMTIPGGILTHLGDTSPNTFVFAAVWPWALTAALFALTVRDHPWLPGATLGLLAGTTGLLSGGETFAWMPYALAATALAVTAATSRTWLTAAAGVVGAAGVFVVAYSAHDLMSINGDGEDIAVLTTAAALTATAAYTTWRSQEWPQAIAPALLLADAVLVLTAEVPQYVTHAALAALIVVPLAAAITTAQARLAAYLVIAAGILVRANDYVSATEPTFTSVAHVALPVAAAMAAYFSASR
ncbi:caspase family protein [Lentzea sp. JNUCC 0626]|uniref:caspase family protein n=1 Tax=Lentzea sp. JNUCC 0626 TaxID=3367513 RepID=UPI003747C4AE